MKKKNINNRKKALTAVGAVVAAGLTPGFIAATPGCLPVQNPVAEITAAEMVAIDGQAYSFDELYAKQHPDSVQTNDIWLDIVLEPNHSTLYGGPVLINTMPQFPGGDAALMKYIVTHKQYPVEALKNRIEGCVVVKFVVDKNGNIGKVKVVNSADKYLDKEAVRVCKSLPKFIPGRKNGKAISSWYTLPITFTLPAENND